MSNNKSDVFRPPLISAGLAAGYGYAANWLYQLGQVGYDIGTVGALVTGGMAVREAIRFLDDSYRLRIYRKRQQRFQASGNDHGQARFETYQQIKSAGLLNKQGVELGSFKHGRKNYPVKYDAENSAVVLGPPGSGKSANIYMRTALTDPRSLIINDNSCEILAVTERTRRNLGNKTLVVTPSPSRVAKIVGRDVEIACLNVYSNLDFAKHPGELRADVSFLTSLWIPKRHDEDGKSKFFRSDGREIIDFITLYLGKKKLEVTLPNIRRMLLVGADEMAEMFAECMNASDFGGVLAEIANGLLMVRMSAPEQYAGGFGVAKQAIGWADHVSEVGQVLSRSTFDVSELKGDQPVTVYFCMPGELAETYQPFANALLSYMWRAVCNDTRLNTVTCLLDECAGLGYLPLFYPLEQGRKHKLRLFLAFQEVAGQAEQIYGKAGLKRIMAAADVVWSSGIRGPETLEMLSKLAGTRAGNNTSFNDRSTFAADRPEQTYANAHASVPLLRPEEIRTLPSDKALVFYRNLQPILLDKRPYFLDPALQALADRNPYYEG